MWNVWELAMSDDEEFKLESWYSSETVKRNLGAICRAIALRGSKPQEGVHLLGAPATPLLVLEKIPVEPGDEEISIDEARADWSNVTLAAAIYGTRFRIQGRRSTPIRPGLVYAILHRHPNGRHPAENYLRSVSPDVERLARQIEVLAQDVRRLGHNPVLQ